MSPLAYDALEACFAAREKVFIEHVNAIESFADALERIGADVPPAPRWTQDWFPRLDAAAAYAVVRRWEPKRIVEVGSGHSTRFLARAVSDARLATRITAIDPRPRARLDGLDIELRRMPVQEAGDGSFAGLAPGDILFIDSSHVLRPGSDVDFLVNRILPALPSGTLVHFHDVFLPNDYPADWHWRGYNEQLAVAVLITSGAYAPEFASAWLVANRSDPLMHTVLARLPLLPGARESSLWLRKTGA